MSSATKGVWVVNKYKNKETLILRAGGFGPETRHIHGVTTYAAKQYSQRERATQGREPTNHEGKIQKQTCAGNTRRQSNEDPPCQGGGVVVE